MIPARGGSKGVSRKNIRDLCGKPLLQYTAETALASNLLTKVILSTEDEEIASIGSSLGLEVPFMRPVELAQDNTPMLPVAQHAMQEMEASGGKFDYLCLLQPTNPLRTTNDIDTCIELIVQSQADSVVSTLPVPHSYNPHWVYFKDRDNHLYISTGEPSPISRRQDLPEAYIRDGSIYVVKRDVLMNQNSLYGQTILGYHIPESRSINIDTMDDWERAEGMLTQRLQLQNIVPRIA